MTAVPGLYRATPEPRRACAWARPAGAGRWDLVLGVHERGRYTELTLMRGLTPAEALAAMRDANTRLQEAA